MREWRLRRAIERRLADSRPDGPIQGDLHACDDAHVNVLPRDTEQTARRNFAAAQEFEQNAVAMSGYLDGPRISKRPFGALLEEKPLQPFVKRQFTVSRETFRIEQDIDVERPYVGNVYLGDKKGGHVSAHDHSPLVIR